MALKIGTGGQLDKNDIQASRFMKLSDKHRSQIIRLDKRSEKEIASLSPSFARQVETVLLHLEGKGRKRSLTFL